MFDTIDGEWIDPPLLMKASIPLELSGEAVRARLCTLVDAGGEEMALRPDLTLAVMLHHIDKAPGTAPVSYRYSGRAFRMPSVKGDAIEFDQAGFERYNAADALDTDVDTFLTVCRTVESYGLKDITLHVGDIAIFNSFVDAFLDTPGSGVDGNWARALKLAFRRTDGIRQLFRQEAPGTQSALANALSGLSREDAETVLAEVFAISDIQPVGGRSTREILARLGAQASVARSGALPVATVDRLNALLSIKGAPQAALQELRSLAEGLKGDVSAHLDHLQAICNRMEAERAPYWSSARFNVQFGRRFNYYDGLVFECVHPSLGPLRPVGAGGRYDGLAARLSDNAQSASAVGGVVRPDRLQLARSFEESPS